jgi:hypothetical protein
MNDVGLGNLTCAGCAINNLPSEGIDLISPSGTYSGTFYYAKTTSAQSGAVLTDIIGVSTNHGSTVALVTNGTGTYGLPVMDDHASVGERWSYSNESSTITSVGQTQPYGGSALIQNVNADAFTGALNITWSFAQGVGFTSLSMNGQTITLTSFSVDPASSQSVGRSTLSLEPAGTVTASQAFSMLKDLF